MKPSPAVSRYIREHDYGARAEPDQVHRLPAVFSDEPQHEISDACRCRPLNEFIWNETKGACTCPTGDPRNVISALVAEAERLECENRQLREAVAVWRAHWGNIHGGTIGNWHSGCSGCLRFIAGSSRTDGDNHA